MLPANCTDLLQPVDSNIGKQIKDALKLKFKEFIHERHAAAGKFNLQVMCGNSKTMTPEEKQWKREINCAHFRRAMLIKWVAEVVKKWRADEASKAAIVHSFTKTGCAVTVDGSGWGAIKPERVQVPFVIAPDG